MNQTFMKTKPILPLVVSMSLPMVLSMLVNSLYNIIDSYFIAKISEEAMTALSLVYPLQLIIVAVAVGFGVGINSTSSFFLGAQKDDEASDAASLGVLLSVIHGLVLTVVCLFIMPYFLGAFTQDETVIGHAVTYATIIFSFTPIMTLSVAFEKIFQAEGKMNISMVCMLLGCVTNIILDPLMIFGIGPFPVMGIRGAALATGIGQVVPLIAYLVIYHVTHLPLKIRLQKKMFQTALCARLYSVGIPATLNMALPSLLITSLNSILASFSESYILVLGIYYKLQSFIYLTANGIVQGIRPLIAYNYGAGERKRVQKIFLTAAMLTLCVMSVGTIICQLIPMQLMQLFTDNSTTISIGETALRIISLGFFVSGISVTVCGAMEGLGKGMSSLFVCLMRYIIAIIPLAFILSRFLGVKGVWHAFWITEVITAILSIIIYRRNITP